MDSLIVELRADISGLQSSLRTASGEVKKFSGQAEQDTRKFTGALSGAKAAIAGIGFAAATYGAVEFGKSVVQAGMDMQALTNRMKAAAGGAQAGAEAIAFVRAESERLGLDLRATADGFAGFMASATRAGLTMRQTQEIFTGVSEAATSLHLSNERVGLVFKALEQIAAKGTVQMEELKGQLGESLPGAFEIAAQAMGVTTQELGKMMERGEVLSSEFLPKFAAAVKQQLGGSVEDASKSAQAAFNRMGNAWFELQAKMAQAGVLDGVTAAVENLTKALSDPATQEGLIAFARLLGDIAVAAAKAMAALGSFYDQTRQNKAALLTDDGLGGNAIDRMQRGNARRAAVQGAVSGAGAKPDASGGLLQGTGMNTYGGLIQNANFGVYNPKGAVTGDGGTFEAENGMSMAQLFGGDYGGEAGEDRLKSMREQLQAEEDLRAEYREIRLQGDTDNFRSILDAEISSNNDRRAAEENLSNDILGLKQDLGNNLLNLAQTFANKNKTIALAMLAFEKTRSIAEAIIATKLAATKALAIDPSGALAARVTALGYANVAVIAATGIAQAASIAGGSQSSGSAGSAGTTFNSASGTYDQNSTTPATSNIVINLQGSDTANFTKNQVRELIGAINDAQKDGTRLNVVTVS